MSFADVIYHLSFVDIKNRLESARIAFDGPERLQDPDSLRAIVMVYDAEPGIVNFSSKRVSQHD